jgi:hypothetical protein
MVQGSNVQSAKGLTVSQSHRCSIQYRDKVDVKSDSKFQDTDAVALGGTYDWAVESTTHIHEITTRSEPDAAGLSSYGVP